MLAFIKQVSHFERQMDATMERFLFRHRVWGFIVMFVGIPIVTLAAVCICTTILVLPMAFVWGWV